MEAPKNVTGLSFQPVARLHISVAGHCVAVISLLISTVSNHVCKEDLAVQRSGLLPFIESCFFLLNLFIQQTYLICILVQSDENLNISERTLLVDMCDKTRGTSALKFGIPALPCCDL